MNVEFKETGIICDNPNCDWDDKTVTHDQLKDWLNVSCPKCGENVLTQEDFDNAKAFYLAMELVNSMTPEEIEEMNKGVNIDELLKVDFFKDAIGLENMKDRNPEGMVRMQVSTHKTVKVVDIKRIDS